MSIRSSPINIKPCRDTSTFRAAALGVWLSDSDKQQPVLRPFTGLWDVNC
jgi:hypothetical protein